MEAREQVNTLLTEHGAELVRKRKHEVWRFPDGRCFVRAQSASDKRADANNLSDLKKLLGIQNEHKEGERRAKRTGNGKDNTIHFSRSPNTGLADQLRLIGVAESTLRDRVSELERENALLLNDNCWLCRLKARFF